MLSLLLSPGPLGLIVPPSATVAVSARPSVSRAALRLSEVDPWNQNAVASSYVAPANLYAASEAVLKPLREAAEKAAAKEAAAAEKKK